MLVIGRVTELDVFPEGRKPLVFFRGDYGSFGAPS
jgi:hypothetical protein